MRASPFFIFTTNKLLSEPSDYSRARRSDYIYIAAADDARERGGLDSRESDGVWSAV